MRALESASKPGRPSIVTLRNAHVITDADIDAAVTIYLDHPTTGRHVLGASGYSLDLAAAVKDHRSARAAIGDRALDGMQRRMAIKTAFLLAPAIEA